MKILQNFFKSPLVIKISDETNLNLEKKIKPIINEILIYSVRRKLRGKEIEIIIPKNLSETVYKWACDEEKEYFDEYGYQPGLGHFSTPLDNESKYFKIIIDSSTFEDLQYFSTLIHEITHVIDFNEYIKKYGNPVFMSEQTKQQKYYYEFYYWTEFNAKKNGLKRFVEELKKREKSIDLYSSASIFIDNVNQRSGRIGKLYELMHFYARITVCDDGLIKQNQNIYPISFINMNFGSKGTVIHSAIEEIKTFKKFEKEKDFLRHLFKKDDYYL